jgi:hypothetical protein
MRVKLQTVLIAGTAMIAGAAQADGIKWAANFDQAMAASKASGKLVMADFYTDW